MWMRNEIDAKLVGDGVWELHQPVVYRHFECIITILPGFVTDLASIPKWYRFRFNPANLRYGPPAVLHDGLYQSEAFDRQICDDIFRMAMSDNGTDAWTRNVLYYAVRLGGGFSWDEHTAVSIADAQKYVQIQTIGRV